MFFTFDPFLFTCPLVFGSTFYSVSTTRFAIASCSMLFFFRDWSSVVLLSDSKLNLVALIYLSISESLSL